MSEPVYDHVWHWKERLPERKGQPCAVLVRGGNMNSLLIQFRDGTKVLCSRHAIRRMPPENTSQGNLL